MKLKFLYILVIISLFMMVACTKDEAIRYTKKALPFIGGILAIVAVSYIAKKMDERDKGKVKEALQNSSSGTSNWNNNGGTNTITTGNNFTDSNGKQCRTYQVKIIVDGNYETGEGKACKLPNGNWEI